MKRISLFLLVSFLGVVCNNCTDPGFLSTRQKATGHPGLILTTGNLKTFTARAANSHQPLFDLLIEQADSFLEALPLSANDAGNQHRWIGDSMPALGLAFLLTGEEKYLEGARKWIDELLNVPTWKGSQNLGRASWVIGCALLYDWLYHHLDQNFRSRIIQRLTAEALIVKDDASYYRALSNHLLIETSAIGITGLILDDGDLNKKLLLQQADEWTNYIIDNAPLDGSWGEGVQYWQYGLGYFLRFLEAAETSGYKNYFTPRITYAETTDLYDYVIGDAGNIYVEEAQLQSFQRHLLFLKPDIVVIADFLEAKVSLRFDWLLQANEIASVSIDEKVAKIQKPRTRLTVHSLLPQGARTDLRERLLDANDVHGLPDHKEGVLKTIIFTSNGSQSHYLMVLDITRSGEAAATISFDGTTIQIVKAGVERRVLYEPNEAEKKVFWVASTF